MNNNLVIVVVLAMLLSACTSNEVKTAPPVATNVSDISDAITTIDENDGAMNSAAQASEMTGEMIDGASIKANPLRDPSNILYKRSIYFDLDKDEIKAEYVPLVEAHARYLIANPDARIFVRGNADERGSREYNLALGQRRSVAVKKLMNVLGVSDRQIETVSYGEEKPQCSQKNETCWQKNRRADIFYESE